MKTMITGLRPTGSITLANYIGGIKNFVLNQYNYQSIIFIADLHGLTTYIEPNEIKANILDITALYLACGINLEHTIIFKQSDVLEHGTLGFLISFQSSVGELLRMTQYKSKKEKLSKKDKDMGLFIYPTLMAADILLYDASIVPVGMDQKQPIEITRDLGNRFNKIYGPTFILPEYQIPKIGAKIMNLQNPSIKMSKSAAKNDLGTIFILDDINITKEKIRKAQTDSENKIYFDEEKKPGISNLISIMAVLNNISIKQVVNKYQNYNYKEFKEAVAETVSQFVLLIQNKFYEYRQDEEYLKQILENGAQKARKIAHDKLNDVYAKIGIKL